MSRDNQGLYSLPAGNPVIPGTLIEDTWANTTMDDIAQALTDSLPRDGSAPMVGLLTLANAAPTQPRHATTKAYVDSFLAYATGMPVGAITAFGGSVAPPGWLKCNGAAVNRVAYSDLFAAIGTTYGAGDGATTFNVPDLRDEFVRGRADGRPVGNKQADALKSHTHAASSPAHSHAQAAHTHGLDQHTHNISDPGHRHGFTAGFASISADNGAGPSSVANLASTTDFNSTGISIMPAFNFGMATVQPTIYSAAVGVSVAATGDVETRPRNIAMDYYIKAVDDSSAGGIIVTSIDSSDAAMIAVDVTFPESPLLDIQSDVAYGIPKLDSAGKIKIGQLPAGQDYFMGFFDASGGILPVGVFNSGSYFTISTPGTLTLYDPFTLLSSPIGVVRGDNIIYVTGSASNPTGWYDSVADSTIFVHKSSETGAAGIPAGTTAQRDVTPEVGWLRFNTTLNSFEGYTPSGWTTVRSDNGSGVLQVVTYPVDSGGVTSSAVLANLTGTQKNFTPKSTNSTIIVDVVFAASVAAAGAGVNSEGVFQLADLGVAIPDAVFTLGTTSSAGANLTAKASGHLRASLNNAALAARGFTVRGYRVSPSGTPQIAASSIWFVVTEVQNP